MFNDDTFDDRIACGLWSWQYLPSALHLVAYFDLAMTMKKLLEHDASNINLGADGDLTPMKLATDAKDGFVFELLLERNDVDMPDRFFGAAKRGHVEGVSLCLSKGADIHMRDAHGLTALDLAAKKGHKDIVQVLLARHGRETPVHPTFTDALYYAVKAGHCKVCQMVLERVGVGILEHKDPQGQTVLHAAASCGRQDVVKLLLQLMSEETLTHRSLAGRTALSDAALRGHRNVVHILLERYSAETLVQSDREGQTALYHAALCKHWEVVQLIIEHSSREVLERQEEICQAVLCNAAAHAPLSMVQLLLERTARRCSSNGESTSPATGPTTRWSFSKDVLARQDMQGRTAVHMAVLRREKEVLAALLELQPDLAIVDDEGLTALRYAMDAMNSRSVRLILEHWTGTKADAAELDRHQMSFIHWSAKVGSCIALEKLLALDLGASVLGKDVHGRTPLQYACKQGDPTVIDLTAQICQGRCGNIEDVDISWRER